MNDPKGWAKTYGLAEYTTGELTYNDYTNPNAVIAGAGYVNYVCVTESSDYGTSYGAMFRGILVYYYLRYCNLLLLALTEM